MRMLNFVEDRSVVDSCMFRMIEAGRLITVQGAYNSLSASKPR